MKIKVNVLIFLFSLFFASFASAGLVLSGTRIIFDGQKKEVTINVTNTSEKPTLVQSWISLDDKRSKDFIVTPPLFRLEGNMQNTLRIVAMDQNLPKDRESLYWLNVKGIPPTDPNAVNTLTFAINTQIKLFYRPQTLSSKEAESAYKQIKFSLSGKTLIAKNPTPFYVTLKTITLGGTELKNSMMIPPFSESKVTVEKTGNSVTWRAINDYGGTTDPETQSL